MYSIHALYASPGSPNTAYKLRPGSLEVRVDQGPVTTDSFAVEGFSLGGKVLAAGQGVEGVRILVDGQHKATTDANGQYRYDRTISYIYEAW